MSWTMLYTNAPPAYDFGYAVEVRHVGTDPSKALPHGGYVPVRQVAVPHDDAKHQSGRYSSGMFFVCDTSMEAWNLAKIGGFTRFTLEEQTQEDNRRKAARQEALMKFADEQGLFMLQLSPRKYAVLRRLYGAGVSMGRFTPGYFAYPEMEQVFAGTYDQCRRHVEEMTDPLPARLDPNIAIH